MRISDWSSDVCSSDRRTMAKDHGSQIKDDETYEALRDEGASKAKAARIANARAGGSLDPRGTDLEARTHEELYDEAKGPGIESPSDYRKKKVLVANGGTWVGAGHGNTHVEGKR